MKFGLVSRSVMQKLKVMGSKRNPWRFDPRSRIGLKEIHTQLTSLSVSGGVLEIYPDKEVQKKHHILNIQYLESYLANP